MMLKEKGFSLVVIILSIALALALGGAGYFYLRSQNAQEALQKKNASRPSAVVPTPLVTQPSADQMVYKTFKSDDGRLSFEYPSTWTQIDIKNLESVVPKDLIDKRGLEMPLLLTDPTGGRIVFTTYRFDNNLDLNQVMNELKADSAKMGAPYEEISRRTDKESLVVDSKIRAGGVVMMNRDIVFLVAGSSKNSIYVVSLASPENVWTKFETIFTKVQASVALSP